MRLQTTPRRGARRRPAHVAVGIETLEVRAVMSASSPTPLLLGLGDVPSARAAELAAAAGATLGPSGAPGILQATGSSAALKRLSVALGSIPGFGYAEPRRTLSVEAVPDDPGYATSQWGLGGAFGVDAPAAWETTTGSTKVPVAVVDTGVDYNHVDLFENIWINQGEIPAGVRAALADVDGDGLITFYDLNHTAADGSAPNQGPGKIVDVNGDGLITGADLIAPASRGGWSDGDDGDADGYVDDLIGWNFVTNTNNPYDDHGHGTHVSGILGAAGNNGVGVAGVNWTVQVMALKFLDASGNGYDATAAAAIEYAAARGAKVINNSYGGTGPVGPALANAIADAARAGSVFVAAASNSGMNIDATPFSPASTTSPNAVTVAAIASDGTMPSFSNYGAVGVDLAAPGVGIYSTLPGNRYGSMNGTSMAAPFVSGAAALLFAANPSWSYAQVIARILGSVTPLGSLAGKTATGGTLDVGAALPPGTAATFLGSDAQTKGDWADAYGSAGYAIAGRTAAMPAGVQFAQAGGTSFTWAKSTADPRGLEAPESGRTATAWYSPTSLSVSLNLGLTGRRTVGLYFVDWDRNGRSQRVEVLDAATGKVLDARTVSSFGDGVYLTWSLRGAVQIRVTKLAGANAVLSGVFLEGATAEHQGTDATTKGDWTTAYGSGGYAIAGGSPTLPSDLGFAVAGGTSYAWAKATSDVRGLRSPTGTGRTATAWYGGSLTLSLNLGAGPARDVSLYFVDWDRSGRSQRVEVVDAGSGAVLDARTVSSFGDGVYLTWSLRGAVQIRITRVAGANAVLSGVFLGGGEVAPPAEATYAGLDATTKGDWLDAYGSVGYALAGGPSTFPTVQDFALSGGVSYAWAQSTSDARGLQTPSGSGRTAKAWYSSTSLAVSLDLGTSEDRSVSLYFVDWDRNGRSQRVEVLDAATGKVLDARTVSSFGDGVYLTWSLRGAVQIRVTKLAGANAVLSGVFLS